ncbi:MAG: VWD domain-containing protein [Cyanobacteria bacterium P01_D01_bin.156]
MIILNSKSLRRWAGLFLAGLLSSLMVFSQPVAAQTNFCETRDIPNNVAQGRSYGDPHINTYDGFHYTFQTVGEFILTYSGNGTLASTNKFGEVASVRKSANNFGEIANANVPGRDFEVQARQSPVPNRDSLSLNTAVAMRVCDQRVGMYVQDSPDGRSLMWVDGTPIQFVNDVFPLNNGGEIQRQNDRNYTVIWPSGDQVALKIINVSGVEFINIMPIVGRDRRNTMVGLLGNFNGNPDDDLVGRDGTRLATRSTYSVATNTLSRALPAAIPVAELETAYFEQLNRQFGDSWRITQAESLFDYPVGMTTANFSDRSFPTQYISLNNASREELDAGVTACREAEVPEDQMDGCVFDTVATGNNGFADAAVNAVANVAAQRVQDQIEDEIEKIIPGGFRLPSF